MVRRLAAMVAALMLSLLLVAPAFADTLDVGENGIDWNDAGKQGTADECDGVVLEAGQVLWHFIVNQSSTNDATLTLDFADDDYDVLAPGMTPTSYSPNTPDAEHYTLHYIVYTNQTTLLGAESSGDGNLQLSHICAGPPPPDVPEAPASVLLLLTGVVAAGGFLLLRQRRNGAALV